MIALHAHLALIHFFVALLPCCGLLLLLQLRWPDERWRRFFLSLIPWVALLALLSYGTGALAFQERQRYPEPQWVEIHALWGQVTTALTVLWGLWGAVVWWNDRTGPPVGPRVHRGLALAAFALFFLALITAAQGGRIHHVHLRP
jgi:hypothetical protein